MLVSNSLIEENVYFIFRECGAEVKITINPDNYESNKQLTDEEKDYVNLYLRNQKYQSKMNRKNRK